MSKNIKIEAWQEAFDYFCSKAGHGIQAKLSRKLKMPDSTYLNKIAKKKRNPGKELQKQIALYFGYSLRDFIAIGNKILIGEQIGKDEVEKLSVDSIDVESVMDKLTETFKEKIEAESYFRDVVDNIQDCVARTDKQGNYTFANKYALGKTETPNIYTIIGKPAWAAAIPPYARELQEIMFKMDFGETVIYELIGAFTKQWREFTITRLPESANDGWQLITRSIHQRKLLEAENAALKIELAKLKKKAKSS